MRVKKWKCGPCRERSQLQSRELRAERARLGEEVIMGVAGRYRLLRGNKRRRENGRIVEYGPGDIMVLNEHEADVLRLSIEPFDPGSAEMKQVQVPQDPITEGPVSEALRMVAAASSLAALSEIEHAEEAGKNRVTVFRAIDSRREELSGEDAED